MGRLLGLVLTFAAAAAHAGPGLGRDLTAAIARVDWTAERVELLITGMPKAELHLHLDGALSPETIKRLATEQNYAPLKDKTTAEIAALSVVSSARPTLAKVLDAFGVVYPLLRDASAVETAAYEAVKTASLSNVRRLEVRFAPALQATGTFSSEDALRAALKGLERGRADFAIGYGVIICLIRPEAFVDMARNEEMLVLALKYIGRGVVGVDLAGNEAAAPLALYAPLLRRAKAGGLGVTVHAGEVPDSKDLETALELGVDRLGHATLLGSRPKILKEVVARGIPVEVNLTSNLRTSAVKSLDVHPAKEWRKLGIPLAVSTDDPGVFAVDLNHEYRLMHSGLGFGPAALITASLQAVDALFLPAPEKAALRAVFEAELLALLERLARKNK